ncbi:hypothetical protein BX600DRAFT_466401 [Xylariales sp. PMI_506]|nr:hypothetical protein BX600DRAFT_466401 [Xylariales sp. PMI_506]
MFVAGYNSIGSLRRPLDHGSLLVYLKKKQPFFGSSEKEEIFTTGWVCRLPEEASVPPRPALHSQFFSCAKCASGMVYTNQNEAIDHLRNAHVDFVQEVITGKDTDWIEEIPLNLKASIGAKAWSFHAKKDVVRYWFRECFVESSTLRTLLRTSALPNTSTSSTAPEVWISQVLESWDKDCTEASLHGSQTDRSDGAVDCRDNLGSRQTGSQNHGSIHDKQDQPVDSLAKQISRKRIPLPSYQHDVSKRPRYS